MAELRKQWQDGELLTATYEGSGNGSAVFSSEVNESIDRELSVAFVSGDRAIVVERKVRQIGLREILRASDGVLYASEGDTLNVLK